MEGLPSSGLYGWKDREIKSRPLAAGGVSEPEFELAAATLLMRTWRGFRAEFEPPARC